MKINTLIAVLFSIILIASCAKDFDPLNKVHRTRISDIQGCGHYSPFRGKSVEKIIGIVTSRVSNGFYLQDSEPDDLVCTSDAVFVFTQSFAEVRPGDKVEVSGMVEEYYPGNPSDHNLPITEIRLEEIRLLSQDNPLPAAIEIGGEGREIPGFSIDDDKLRIFQPDQDGIDFFESLESMLVMVSSGQVVGARNDYNEVVILIGGYDKFNMVSSDGALLMGESDFNPERVILNLSSVNQDPVDVGAVLENPAIGIMDYEYGNYKVNTFGKVNFKESQFQGNRSAQEVGESIRLVSLNVENLSMDDRSSKLRRLAELVTNQLGSPEILLLHEVMDDSGTEDDGTVSAIETIEKIKQAILDAGGVKYESIVMDPQDNADGGIPGGNIRSVILFEEQNEIQFSKSGILPANPLRIGEDSIDFANTRKPLVTNLSINGREVIVIAVHLTSRGADSPLFGEIQPISEPERSKRMAQASYIGQYVRELLRKSPETIVLVAGDFNDYPWSDTLTSIKGGATLFDVGELIVPEERYTYIFDGNAFQFDTILISTTFPVEGIRAEILHINTLLDETLQFSDHDPVLVDLSIP